MKKTEKLLELIRKVVREEVRSVIQEELESKKKLTKEAIQHGMNLNDIVNSPKNPYEQGTRKRKQKEDFQFTKDPVLNKVLNETANKDEWPTMGGAPFTAGKEGLASMMGMQSPEQMFGGKPSVEQMLPNDRKHVQIDDNMADILTRDYSQLMKKVDEKVKNKRP